jgi:hypothetical protein
MSYQSIIEQFIYSELPQTKVSKEVQFEALSATVFGTKQRRYGPMPTPEVQASIREILRSPFGNPSARIEFFVPWGSSKQEGGAPLDLLELMALRQLDCLAHDLARLGYEAHYTFRIENNTDRLLFKGLRDPQISEYAQSLKGLIEHVLPGSTVYRESDLVSFNTFRTEAERHSPKFYNFIEGNSQELPKEWKGTLPQEQIDYYLKAYESFYDSGEHVDILSWYFAASLARVTLGAQGKPNKPHIQLNFSKPVPGNPYSSNRLYLRTLPERYTHQHHAPWLAQGVFQIDDLTNDCKPQYWQGEGGVELPTVLVGGVPVQTPFMVINNVREEAEQLAATLG